MRKIWLSICVVASVILSVAAQDAASILERYVQMGLEQNLTLQLEKQNVKKRFAALKEAKSLFYPNLSFEASYTSAVGGRTIDIPIGDLLNPVYQTLNQLSSEAQFPTQIPNASEKNKRTLPSCLSSPLLSPFKIRMRLLKTCDKALRITPMPRSR